MIFQLAVLIFVVVFGIPIQIIDYRHRKKRAYEPGDAWAYYSRLSKQGSREGKFMLWSSYCGIALIVGVIAYAKLRFFTA